MKRNSPHTFLFCAISLCLLFFISCTLVASTPAGMGAPIASSTYTPSPTSSTDVKEATLEVLRTPPAWVTIVPSVGDLGWGSVHGRITDGVTNAPIAGALVQCSQSSYTSPFLCKGFTNSDPEGMYAFIPVFFHDTDRITLSVEAPGYTPFHFEQSFFTQPDLHADLVLIPASGETPQPVSTPIMIMCTPPPCPAGSVFICGGPNGCPGGCGTTCIAVTSTP